MRWWKRLVTARISLFRILLVHLLVCAGVVAGYGLSVVRAQDSDNAIHACVNTWNGVTRIVDSADDCTRSEYSESWNKQGPKGPAGPQGDPGPPGNPGPSGEPSGLRLVTKDIVIPAGALGSDYVLCPDGMTAVTGGSLYNPSNSPGLSVVANGPYFGTQGRDLATNWRFNFDNDGTTDAKYRMWVLCTSD